MQPIKFPESNFTWGVPPGHEDRLLPLPCWVERAPNGAILTTLSLWELTDEEIDWIVKNRKIWLKQANNGQPLQPQLMLAQDVEFPKPFAFCSVYYQSNSSLKGAWVWVSENIHIPELINMDGELYAFSDKYKPRLEVGKALDIDALYFRTATPAEASERFEKAMKDLDALPEIPGGLSRDEAEHHLRQMTLVQPILVRRLQAGKEEILF